LYGFVSYSRRSGFCGFGPFLCFVLVGYFLDRCRRSRCRRFCQFFAAVGTHY
jgi:hypothetical protein